MRARPRLVFLVNEDAFFVSHRLELGIAARRAGFDVVVAAGPGGAAASIRDHGLRSVELSFDRGGRSVRRDAITLASIAALYRRERPVLVHHVTIKPVLYGTAIARALGVPAIVNAISGLGYVFLSQQRALRAAVRGAYRLVLAGRNVRTIFQNPDDLEAFVSSGLVPPASAVRIDGSGVDLVRFRHVAEIPGGAPVVVLPARMLWDKGVAEFVEAARIVRATRSDVRFVLAGRADETNPARVPRETLDGWHRSGVVEWWGHRQDMPSVLAQASLVALPSYREGLPLALVEALAVGRACVTTDVPGCRDVIDDRTGWLVPPRDASALAHAILAALADRDELLRRSAAARARAEARFSRAVVVERQLELYRSLLGDRWPA